MVLIIAAVGVSGSGKTTTIEYLITKLTKEGYKVAAIKHIHRENFTIDKEGSNTWRFTNAGSKLTVAFSPEEIAIIQKTKTSITDLEKVIKQIKNQDIDIIFIEGFHSFIAKQADIIKIVTAITPEDLDKTLKQTVPPVIAIAGLVAKNKPTSTEVPYINLPDEGNLLLDLVKKHLLPKSKMTKRKKIR